MRILSLFLATVSCLTEARPAQAAQIEGVDFNESFEQHGKRFDLSCLGLLRYKVLFRGYVAGLYLEPGVASSDALKDVPKRLELSYFWSIKGSDFAGAADEILARNVAPETLTALRPRLAQLNALYRDVEPNDRYSLTYVPGIGTELALNGKALGTIPGADFAEAYFRIWLGEKSIDNALRDQLLLCNKRA